ncbi:DUF6443 domain-containing protein [Sphingobacterium anhuiense]|uniref:DUF6443 domain-containing protein n=1 Tax=Sphingobacterium anhuiense TaxID=493780 RepID=A0ABW5YVG3_9SPHI
MKRHISITIAIASGLSAQSQVLPKDTSLTAYTGQTSIQALGSITLKNGFHIPVQQSGKSVTISIVGFQNLLSQPSTGQNYILTKIFKKAGVSLATLNAQRTIGEENQSIQYIDGLGRPLQTVQLMASPSYKDIVQHIEYDGFGRESTKYLPYAHNKGNGSYKISGKDSVVNFYNKNAGVDIAGVVRTDKPFAVTVFENSPLNRVQEQGAPGADWQPLAAEGTGHTIKTTYGTNTATGLDAVKLWTIEANGTKSIVNYGAGKLYRTTVRDENSSNITSRTGSVDEYKDFEDRVVLKRLWETESKSLNTYYVYDDFGDLRYVIPPGVATLNTTASVTVTEATTGDFHELVYAYRYDGRRRLIEKKVPGKGWEWLVYNENDQVVMTQDAVQRSKTPTNEWSYNKYDAFGRIVVTGTYVKNYASQKLAQDDVNLNKKYWEERYGVASYTTASFPVGSPAVLTTNYYDDYSFSGSGTAGLGFIGATKSTKTKGLLTGVSVTKDDGTLPLLTINYYDDYGRVIQSSSENHIKGTDVVTNTYSFVGELKTSTRIHKDKAGTATTTVISNEYDHVGRLLATKHQIGDVSKAVTLVKNEYNEIGQLKKKNVGGDKDGANFHTGLSYAYNERGWTSSASSKEFSYKLKYNDASAGKQYNGNIAQQEWVHGTTPSNVFNYSYDALNRLKNGTSTGTVMSELLTYDDMGNIKTLTRDGATITYAYNNVNKSNRLLSVTGGGLSGNYTYDVNGNAKKDRTGMNFNYNHLNLPDSAWNDTKTVKVGYLYDAMGTKLRKYSTQGGNRDYVGSIEYNGTAIELIHTGEGVAYRNSNGTYTYRYNLTDHLGNVRSTIYRNPTNNAVEVLQRDDFYPFGKQRIVAAGNNKYLYNGKEIQGELGGQYDYGARFYDADIGRWNVVDPLAEVNRRWSPYRYAYNNPLRYIDPDGMLEEPTPEEAARIAAHVYQDPKEKVELIGGWKVSNRYVGLSKSNFTNSQNGIKSALYERTTDGVTEYSYATAGTEIPDIKNLQDVFANLGQISGTSEQYDASVSNAKKIKENLNGEELTYVGHSLGGGEASANSLATGDKAITFNSAGLSLPTRIKYGGIGAAFGNWGNITSYQLKSDPLTIAQDLSVLPGALGNIKMISPYGESSRSNGHSIMSVIKSLMKR